MHAQIHIHLIYTHTHTHVTLHPVTMLRMSGAKVPSPYAFTACTGTILATVTENFFSTCSRQFGI